MRFFELGLLPFLENSKYRFWKKLFKSKIKWNFRKQLKKFLEYSKHLLSGLYEFLFEIQTSVFFKIFKFEWNISKN